MNESTDYVPQLGEFYVYVLRNPLKPGCPPFYVGKGQTDRAFDHFKKWALENENPYRANTIRKILCAELSPQVTCAWHGTDEATAFWVERFLIAFWKRKCDGGILTNLSTGGEGPAGLIFSEDTRRKMSDAKRGKPLDPEHVLKIAEANRGRTHSAESRAKFSAGRRAMLQKTPFSAETRAKMSAAAIGRKRTPEAIEKTAAAHRGRKRSAETRAKMSAALKGIRKKRPTNSLSLESFFE